MEDKFWFQMLLLSLAFVSGAISFLKVIFEKKIKILASDDSEEVEEKLEKIEKQKSEKRFAFAFFLLLLATTFLNTLVSYQKDKKTTLYKQQADESFSMVSEASGGVAIENYVYLVDDDKPKLFRARYVDDKKSDYFGRYDPRVVEIDLYTKYPSAEELAAEEAGEEDENPVPVTTEVITKPVSDDKKSKSAAANQTPKPKKIKSPIIRKGQVNDFEAAARYGGFIYLVTSHSDSKSKNEKAGEGTARQRFIEVRLDKVKTKGGEREIGVVTRWANLRVGLENALFNGKKPVAEKFRDIVEAYAKEDVQTVMQVEGLAIDKAGTVYLGFRGPDSLNKSCALIARTTLDEIFKPEEGKPTKWQPVENTPYPSPARYTVLDVNIGGSPEDQRGIVDMLYWKNKILLLTNSVKKYKLNTRSEILSWSGKGEDLPEPLGKDFYDQPDYIFAKPEVLLLPDFKPMQDKAVIFLDGQNFGGGQRIFSRRENNIE